MKIPYYHVDAFASERFRGNPAGVCVLKEWIEDAVLQRIASENNLSETAFFVPNKDAFDLRWFTPAIEVDLCGHATVAAAFVVYLHLRYEKPSILFHSKSGDLKVAREGGRLVLDFPSRPGKPVPLPADLVQGLGAQPKETFLSRDYLAVFSSQEEILALKPDMRLLEKLEGLGVIATAPGKDCDFVSRFFAPKAGVPEDPVTGSAHCTLVPYWSQRLGKAQLHARQISRRGGELFCRDEGGRVKMGGHAVIYLEGEIQI